MTGELHCHSRFSDGTMSVDDLVFYAKKIGLGFLSITDHDTLAGVTRAAVVGRRYGVEVIAGCEISCYDARRSRQAHILCYLPEKPDRLQGMLGRILESRQKAGLEMVERLRRIYPITNDYFLRYSAGSQAIYKVHLMHALMDQGYTDRIYGELYHELFDKGGRCYIPLEYPDVRDAVDLIHSAGGLAVLAHPGTYDSYELLAELLAEGRLDGVEANYPSATQQDREILEQLLEGSSVIRTGGTDFHGFYSRMPRPLGTCVTERDQLEKLYACKENKKAKA